MRSHFPEAMVPRSIEEENRLTLPDPNDRHVAATASVCAPAVIVTWNLRDFPTAAMPTEVGTEHPDAFLRRLLAEQPTTVLSCITDQAASTGRHGRPKLSVANILGSLELAGAPGFATDARAILATPVDS